MGADCIALFLGDGFVHGVERRPLINRGASLAAVDGEWVRLARWFYQQTNVFAFSDLAVPRLKSISRDQSPTGSHPGHSRALRHQSTTSESFTIKSSDPIGLPYLYGW